MIVLTHGKRSSWQPTPNTTRWLLRVAFVWLFVDMIIDVTATDLHECGVLGWTVLLVVLTLGPAVPEIPEAIKRNRNLEQHWRYVATIAPTAYERDAANQVARSYRSRTDELLSEAGLESQRGD